ncbi:SMI1/KNR4 family protein [Streptomyces niger]|uniref:SMI1/KNR4 family protein n=1 Tax=Streptomyces niger TaxID=66373 RepID=UPI00069BD879|nr:SMI1/KNR4 family protein [Streptomyces niger]
MVVEVPDEIRDQCTRSGPGVVYALKVLCAQLAADPLMGTPGWEPSEYVVHVDDETFDDCPALDVVYAYGPPASVEGVVQVRSVDVLPRAPARTTEPEHAGRNERPLADAVQARQVTEAWRRIEAWLRRNAPTTHAALKPGASESEIAACEAALGVRVPASLRALWRLCAGSLDVRGAGLLPDHGWALMDLDAVARSYRWHMESRRRQEQRFGEEEGMPLWRPSWIPFCSWSVTDLSYGMFVDGGTGETGRWTETAERTVEDLSLTMFLEETADRLEYPKLFPGYRPGLIGSMLVWGPPLTPDEKALWEPWHG